MKEYQNVDHFILEQPEAVQPRLMEMREVLRALLPDATEVISYGMPAYKKNKVLVYFAGNAKQIGFYPTSSGVELVKDQLVKEGYSYSKGTIHFPHKQELPYDLIEKIVRFRQEEDKLQVKIKKQK